MILLPIEDQRMSSTALSRPGSPGAIGGPSELESRAAAALRIFATLWAVAVLFHYFAYPMGLIGLNPTLMMLSAVWVLLRPSSLVRFLTMVGLQVAVVAYAYPEGVSNHWLFTVFVNATILLAAAGLLLSRRQPLTPGGLFLRFAPVVRIEVLVLYFFVVFHKLNRDFLNPEVSCATTLYTEIAEAYALPSPSWMLAVLPVGTLIIETAIPLLLVVRRTRVAGALLGVVFHAGLALSPAHTYSDFSSMLYAGYFLFLPYDFAGTLRSQWVETRIGQALIALWDRGTLPRAIKMGLVALAAIIVTNWVYQAVHGKALFTLFPAMTLRYALIFVWVLYAGFVLAILVRAARAVPLPSVVRPLDALMLPSPALAVLPLLLLLNGFNPYLGFKTESSFSMFSNLRTEGGQANHLLVPPGVQVAGFQNDLVQILDSSDPILRMIADDEHVLLLPFVEFKRKALTRKNASVTYIHNGERIVVPRIGDDPVLSRPEPFLHQKLLTFRTVDTYEKGFRCSH